MSNSGQYLLYMKTGFEGATMRRENIKLISTAVASFDKNNTVRQVRQSISACWNL